MKVTVDPEAGFCFGVENAIAVAEKELAASHELYCLEDIVHNTTELERLKRLGLKSIRHEELPKYKGKTVMIRAHGEPPETYRIAEENQIRLIEATCPIVFKLQERIHTCYQEAKGRNIQIVIFGKKGHAEVTGLLGNAGPGAIVVSDAGDLAAIDFSRPVRLYSQTTMDIDAYDAIGLLIQEKMQTANNNDLVINNSYCRQVSRRSRTLREFASSHDVLIFVSDAKSSNGAFLFSTCKAANPNSYFVTDASGLDAGWFSSANSVGVSGATSTPTWLLENVAEAIIRLENDITD